MMPDFVNVKQHLKKQLFRYMEQKLHKGDPLLSMIQRRTQMEGDKYAIQSENGVMRKDGFEKFESEFFTKEEEIIEKGIVVFFERINEAANSMLKQTGGMMFRKMQEATERTGNVIDGGGNPLTPDLLLNIMDKVEMDFDDEGNPKNMAFVMSPDMWSRYKDKIEKWDKEPEVIAKRERMYEKKRREWLDRESNRKLVD